MNQINSALLLLVACSLVGCQTVTPIDDREFVYKEKPKTFKDHAKVVGGILVAGAVVGGGMYLLGEQQKKGNLEQVNFSTSPPQY